MENTTEDLNLMETYFDNGASQGPPPCSSFIYGGGQPPNFHVGPMIQFPPGIPGPPFPGGFPVNQIYYWIQQSDGLWFPVNSNGNIIGPGKPGYGLDPPLSTCIVAATYSFAYTGGGGGGGASGSDTSWVDNPITSSVDDDEDYYFLFDENQINCFVGGTVVATEKGLIPIESVKKGERVHTYDPELKSGSLQFVERLILAEEEQFMVLDFGTEVIRCTPAHKFYTENWVPAKELKGGDAIMGRNGQPNKLNAIYTEIKLQEVFNLHVSTNHNYFVGNLELLVHNDKEDNTDDTPDLQRGTNSVIGILSNLLNGSSSAQRAVNIVSRQEYYLSKFINSPDFYKAINMIGNYKQAFTSAAYNISRNGRFIYGIPFKNKAKAHSKMIVVVANTRKNRTKAYILEQSGNIIPVSVMP